VLHRRNRSSPRFGTNPQTPVMHCVLRSKQRRSMRNSLFGSAVESIRMAKSLSIIYYLTRLCQPRKAQRNLLRHIAARFPREYLNTSLRSPPENLACFPGYRIVVPCAFSVLVVMLCHSRSRGVVGDVVVIQSVLRRLLSPCALATPIYEAATSLRLFALIQRHLKSYEALPIRNCKRHYPHCLFLIRHFS